MCLLESSSSIVNNWKFLARELRITETEIKVIESTYRENIRERAFQMMVKWKEKMGRSGTPRKFIQALRKQDLTASAGENLCNN